jgi:hypothetical protein
MVVRIFPQKALKEFLEFHGNLDGSYHINNEGVDSAVFFKISCTNAMTPEPEVRRGKREPSMKQKALFRTVSRRANLTFVSVHKAQQAGVGAF